MRIRKPCATLIGACMLLEVVRAARGETSTTRRCVVPDTLNRNSFSATLIQPNKTWICPENMPWVDTTDLTVYCPR